MEFVRWISFGEKMKLRIALLALLIGTPGIASASTINDTFTTTYISGPDKGDTLTGTISLDVENGVADAGTLTITGAGLSGTGLPGTETLGLVPAGQKYMAQGGNSFQGESNIFPVTSDGIGFGTNAPGFGDGSGSGGFGLVFLANEGFIVGPGITGFSDVFGPTTFTAAVPEPSTWAMMILGFCGLGFMAYRRKQSGASFRVA
jgi:PEP-CTERM motif